MNIMKQIILSTSALALLVNPTVDVFAKQAECGLGSLCHLVSSQFFPNENFFTYWYELSISFNEAGNYQCTFNQKIDQREGSFNIQNTVTVFFCKTYSFWERFFDSRPCFFVDRVELGKSNNPEVSVPIPSSIVSRPGTLELELEPAKIYKKSFFRQFDVKMAEVTVQCKKI